MEQSKIQNPVESRGEGLSPLELKAAQDTTLAFLMAVKNYGLFPPDHVSTINLLNTLSNTIGNFLQKYGPLRLDIEKGQVRYEEEVVFAEPNPDNNPAFIFYRDGILWLEFLVGLKPHEMLGFFRVISRFSLAQEDPEGDMVTELWGCDFEHINYQASESLWEAEPILEFSLLNPDAQEVLQYSVASVAGFDMLKSVLGIAGHQASGSVSSTGTGVDPGAGFGSGAATSSGGYAGGVFGDGGSAGGGSVGGGAGGVGAGDGGTGGVGAGGVGAGDGGTGGVGTGGAGAGGGGTGGVGAGGVGAGGGGTGGVGAGGDGSGGGGTGGVGTGGDGTGGDGSIGGGQFDGNPGGIGTGGFGPPIPEENSDGQDFWATLRRMNPSGQGPGGNGESGYFGSVRDSSGPVEPGGGPASLSRRRRSGGVSVYSATGHIPGAIGDDSSNSPGSQLRRAGSADMEAVASGGGTPVSHADRKATSFSRPGRGGGWNEAGDEEDSYISVNVASIEPGQSLWQFTVEESAELTRMVREYEEGDNSVAIIELLLLLLRLEDEPLILSAILSFLKEEFRISLSGRRFDIGHALLVKVNDVVRELPPDKSWVHPLLSGFFEDIVEPEILDALTSLWPELPEQKPEVLLHFSALLKLLSPRAGVALVPLLSQVKPGVGRRILIDMIAVFASRDLAIIEQMLDRPEEDLLLRLVHVIRDAPDHLRTEPLLIKALRHSKEQVRQEACEILLERDSEEFVRIFQLINDPSPAIRRMVFSYLGRERNQEVEELFLSYITTERFMIGGAEHITNCYLTLGQCGSFRALPYLQQVLFGQPWNFLVGIGTGLHRQGAAMALSKLRTKDSLKMLGEAENSAFSHIRKAWRKATGN